MMEEISKNILYVSYTCQVKNTARMNTPLTALFGDSVMQEQIRKHSTLFNDSSDSDGEVRNTDEVVVTDIVPAVEFFEAFVNKFTNKDTEYRANKLKLFREDCSIQVMAKTAFDFNLDDSTRLENLFGPIGNIKKMWLFIYLSFHDQEMLMLELRHKQYAEDFNKLNEFQIQKGMFAKTQWKSKQI